jgi:hypothetical protein
VTRGVPAISGPGCRAHPKGRLAAGVANEEIAVGEQEKAQALERAARLLGRDGQASRLALGSLWDEAFENGRLAALDELQDRFCVCMK